MSIEAWIGIASIVVLLILTIGGFLLRHVINDAQHMGEVKAEIANIKQTLGTRETGVIGSVHKQSNSISRLYGVMLFIADKLHISIRKDQDEDK